jgi:hypothetical protein
MEYEHENPDMGRDRVICLGCMEEWEKDEFADFIETYGFFRQQFYDILEQVYGVR